MALQLRTGKLEDTAASVCSQTPRTLFLCVGVQLSSLFLSGVPYQKTLLFVLHLTPSCKDVQTRAAWRSKKISVFRGWFHSQLAVFPTQVGTMGCTSHTSEHTSGLCFPLSSGSRPAQSPVSLLPFPGPRALGCLPAQCLVMHGRCGEPGSLLEVSVPKDKAFQEHGTCQQQITKPLCSRPPPPPVTKHCGRHGSQW